MKRDLVAWSLGLDRHGWFDPSRAGIHCPTRSGRIRFPGVSRLVGAFSFCGPLREPCAGLKTTSSGPHRSLLRFHVECFSMWKMCSLTLSVDICREPLHDGIRSMRDQMSSDFPTTCGACSSLNGVRYCVRFGLIDELFVAHRIISPTRERAMVIPTCPAGTADPRMFWQL